MNEIRLWADYHTHTYYSDGQASVEDMAQAAIKRKLSRIAITDHGSGHLLSGVRKWDKLYADVETAREKYSSEVEILLGAEANLMSRDGKIDIAEKDIKRYDLILVGLHKTAVTLKSVWQFHIDTMLASEKKRKKLAQITAKAYEKAMERYPVGIIAHPGYAVAVDMNYLADAADKNRCIIEINSRHNFIRDEELKSIQSSSCGFVIDSDAHLPNQVADFQNGINDAMRCGIGNERITNAYGGNTMIKGVNKWY